MNLRGRQIYFMHVPKAGGTSMRHMLAENFDVNDVFPTPQMLRATPTVYNDAKVFREVWAKAGRDDWAMVSAHVPYWQIMDLLSPDALKVTVMREPLARAISEIAHHRAADARWGSKEFDEIVVDHPHVYRKRFGVGSYFARAAARSRTNLVRFDVVGLQSHFDETVALLAHKVGYDLTTKHSNRGGRGDSIPTDVSLRSLYHLQAALQADADLYSVACFKFHQQLNALRQIRHTSKR